MKRSEFRKVIREVLDEIFTEELQSITTEDAYNAAEKLGVKGQVDIEELRKGMEVEQEHSKSLGKGDKLTLAKIAIDHLNELPDYYTRLDKMEKKSEVSTTGNVAGYMTPKAFQGKKKKKCKK
jgi:hypothetical protein